MIDYNNIPFVEAKWKTVVSPGRHIQLIVLHSMEAPERPNTAENVAQYFARGERQASAHFCVDSDSIVQCVQTKDVAWAAPNANRNGVHIEMAGYARQTQKDWLDEYSKTMLLNVAGLCKEVLMKKFSVPANFLNAAWLKLAKVDTSLKGFTTHLEVSRAFNPSGHTDPGMGFPIDLFLEMLK